MTIRSSPDVAFFLVGGYDMLSAGLSEINAKTAAITEEGGGVGRQWAETLYVGVRRAELSQSGFFDDGANNVHAALSTGPGVSRVACLGLEGTATGARFIGFSGAMQLHYEKGLRRNELTKAMAQYQGDGVVENGRIVRMWASATASGTTSGTPLDNVVSTTGGGAGYLQVSELTTFLSVTVSLLHSSDNVTYANLTTFASSTAAPQAVRNAISGTIERYVIAGWPSTGATGMIKFFTGLYRG